MIESQLFMATLLTGLLVLSIFIIAAFIIRQFSVRRRDGMAAREITIGTLFLWSDDPKLALEQVSRGFEWRISQWQSFGKAVLVALLGFVSAILISLLKEEMDFQNSEAVFIVILGVVFTITVYGFTQLTITRIRSEFMAIVRIIMLLK